MNKELLNSIRNMYNLELSVNIPAIRKNTQKVSLDELDSIPWGKLEYLNILGTTGSDEIKELEKQYAFSEGFYLNRTERWLFVLGVSKENVQEYIEKCGERLRVLSVRFTSIRDVDVSGLPGLKELNLDYNRSLTRVIGLETLQKIKKLDMLYSPITGVLNLDKNELLSYLQIGATNIEHINLDHPLPKMKTFFGWDTKISDVHFLIHFPNLMELSLLRCPIQSLDKIEFPLEIESLLIGGTDISRIPESIRLLKKIYYLDISELQLTELPDWLPDLGLEISSNGMHGLDLTNTQVAGVDMSIFSQPQDVILKWFEERKKANTGAPLNEVKVVFLGDGEAGKSHCIARLLKGGEVLPPEETPDDSTPGIVITDQSYQIGDRDVQVHFWDFGGQEILHSMHRMFLTERTLYVVLLNARDDTQDDRARYWLHNVKSFANGAPVLLVLNKKDQNPNASVNESDLRAIYPGLTEVVKLSAKFDDQEAFNRSFTEAMKRQIGKMDNLGFFFPATWTRAKQRLLTMTENYIKGSDYANICDESGVTDEGDLRRSLLNWFNDLGVSICYSKHIRLQDYVILRPNWITNAVYAILFNKHPDTSNGIISHKAIFEMIQPPKEGTDPYRRTNSAEVYTQAEIDYILGVTRKFRLSFQVDGEREFIPMLCQRESLPMAAEYAADPDALEFRMTFDYLPSNVLHRLMVELRQELDTDHVWRTGAHFVQKSSGLSALVKTGGNVLQIYVQGTKPFHRPNTYLCILKDAIDQIVKDMNLAAPVNEVMYKLEGKVQAFDYDELVESLDHDETTRYSRAHKRRLRIEDILNQTGHRAKEAQLKLLQDVYLACQQMQSQKIYWNLPAEELRSKEDIRNDCIRNALRGQRYIVSDQSRSGISPGGSQAGRLDMDIRLEPNVPWTIYEALNIRKATKSDMDRWDAHLDKLLGPYNPNGLPFLFLVSYVDCPKDAFTGVWSAYFEHLRFHSAGAYELRSAAQLTLGSERYDPNHYIQAAKCIYDRGGFPTTVYHIFVHLGD